MNINNQFITVTIISHYTIYYNICSKYWKKNVLFTDNSLTVTIANRSSDCCSDRGKCPPFPLQMTPLLTKRKLIKRSTCMTYNYYLLFIVCHIIIITLLSERIHFDHRKDVCNSSAFLTFYKSFIFSILLFLKSFISQ